MRIDFNKLFVTFLVGIFSLFFSWYLNAGLPPTTSKISGDSSDITTFKYRFPHFSGTHSGTTVSLDVNSLSGGGTGSNLTPVNGGIVYSTGSAMAISSSGVAGQYLQSNGAAAPSWVSAPAASLAIGGSISSGTANRVLFENSSNQLAEDSKFSFDGTTLGAPQTLITSQGTSIVPLTIKGASGQSAILTEWQNSTGTSLANMNQNGLLTTTGFLTSGDYSSVNGNMAISSGPAQLFGFKSSVGTAVAVPIIAQGTTSQSGDLTQWQNSTGTVLASINSAGQYVGDGSLLTGISGGGITINSSAITSGGVNRILFESAANKVSENSSLTFDTVTLNAPRVFITNPTIGNVAQIIRGAASQSAPLTQWQNSTGTVLVQVDKDGMFLASSSTSIPLAVKGAASQSAALTTWRNTGGTVLTQIDANGEFTASAATIVPLSVKGAASQSGNLFQIKNSSGTILTGFNSAGEIFASAAAIVPLSIKGAASQSAALTTWKNSSGTVLIQIGSAGDYTSIASSSVAIGVRGAASQFVDLQQWKNANGTPLTKIASSGELVFQGSTSGSVTIKPAAIAGSVTLTLPTSGGSSGQFLSTNGSGVTSWATATAEIDPTVSTTLMEEWLSSTGVGNLGWTVANTGSASGASMVTTGINSTDKAIGEVSLTTGTTAAGRAAVSLGTNTSANNIGLGFTDIIIQQRIELPTLSDGTNTYGIVLGLGDDATSAGITQTNGVYFNYDSTASANWQCVTKAGGVATTTTSSAAVSTSYTTLKIVINNTGTSVGFYVNGALVCTNTTNIPLASGSQFIFPIQKIAKSVGTAARLMNIDYYYQKTTWSSR